MKKHSLSNGETEVYARRPDTLEGRLKAHPPPYYLLFQGKDFIEVLRRRNAIHDFQILLP
jgi:hypothetical protein